jgi:toxin ParE1/3/4
MRPIRVTRDAEDDLEQLWRYIARDSVDAANGFLDQLTTRLVVVAASPKMGRMRDELKPGLRSHPVGNYVIYYRETGANISILHIVHGARDPKRVFTVRK